MKRLLFAATIFLASCTAGTQSITGKVWTDYIPSVVMFAGIIIFLYGLVFKKKGYKDQPKEIAMAIGVILALAGFFILIIS